MVYFKLKVILYLAKTSSFKIQYRVKATLQDRDYLPRSGKFRAVYLRNQERIQKIQKDGTKELRQSSAHPAAKVPLASRELCNISDIDRIIHERALCSGPAEKEWDRVKRAGKRTAQLSAQP